MCMQTRSDTYAAITVLSVFGLYIYLLGLFGMAPWLGINETGRASNVVFQTLSCLTGTFLVGLFGITAHKSRSSYLYALVAAAVVWLLIKQFSYSVSAIDCGNSCIPGITPSSVANSALVLGLTISSVLIFLCYWLHRHFLKQRDF